MRLHERRREERLERPGTDPLLERCRRFGEERLQIAVRSRVDALFVVRRGGSASLLQDSFLAVIRAVEQLRVDYHRVVLLPDLPSWLAGGEVLGDRRGQVGDEDWGGGGNGG